MWNANADTSIKLQWQTMDRPDAVSNMDFLSFCIFTISDIERDTNGLGQGLGDASNLVSSILKSSPTYLYKMLLQHKNACFLNGSSQLK